MLLLCSDGLSSQPLKACVSDQKSHGTAALVVTADQEYKAENYHVPRCREELTGLGFQVSLFDVDVQPVSQLQNYDLVEFIGGNPYYLLRALKKCNAGPVLSTIAANKILIGWSAGALVLGPDIQLIEGYSPEMNLWGLKDLTGMGLTDIRILPHYSKFLKRYEHCEERCVQFEQAHHCSVTRLNDGEGVRIGKDVVLIRSL